MQYKHKRRRRRAAQTGRRSPRPSACLIDIIYYYYYYYYYCYYCYYCCYCTTIKRLCHQPTAATGTLRPRYAPKPRRHEYERLGATRKNWKRLGATRSAHQNTGMVVSTARAAAAPNY